jgi:hypothetical protein
MRSAWFSLALSSLSCASVSVPGPRFPASEVAELVALPPGYVAGEGVRASCTVAARSGALEQEALGNVDCNFERLSRVLRARAGELSVPYLVGKECQGSAVAGGRLECSATLARRTSNVALSAKGPPSAARPAPSPAQVLDIDDPRPQDSEQIRVSFEPLVEGAQARFLPRAYDRVAETAWPAVGRRALGQVSARCESCGAESLRYALRVTAGYVGAGDVAAVKCFQEPAGLRCVATALVPWSS